MEVGEEDQKYLISEEKREELRLRNWMEMGPNFFSELLPNNREVIGECHTFLNFSSSSNSSNIGGGNDIDDENEDKDMANCLILLAQGEPAAASQPSSFSLGKFNSRDPEGQNGASKAAEGCAYECKTCRRTFPSFQALGGHRSSHNHKNTATAADHYSISTTSPADKQLQQRFNNNNNLSNQLDQVRMSRSDYYNNFKTANHRIKVHECSVCGADFISGQALGGHMRSHRRGCGSGASRDSSEIDGRCSKKQRSNLLCLDLNLNLPAPENDKRENSDVVAMAATNLVDCHY